MRIDLRRGERRAFLRSVKLPRRVRPGQRVRARVTLRRVRGGTFERTYAMRIPRGLGRGARTLRFSGTDADVADDGLLGAIIIGGFDDGAGDPGPRNLRPARGADPQRAPLRRRAGAHRRRARARLPRRGHPHLGPRRGPRAGRR